VQFLSKADYSISLTQNAKDEIHSWSHIPNQPIPIEVIPCCADFNHFSEQSVVINEVTAFKKSFGISEDDFVVSYLGSIGTWYMLPEMLDFFKQLLSVKPKAKFLFITQEPVGLIMDLVQQKNIASDRIIIQKANRNEVPTLVSLSHVNLFFILPVFSKKASSPTKMGEVMGMGIPIICNSGVGDVDKIIQESNCGILVNNFNDREYLKAINELDDLLLVPKKQIMLAAQKYYSLEGGVSKYKKVYQELI
jgi:glycosyltransferase involved in cell wall biosynthesis